MTGHKVQVNDSAIPQPAGPDFEINETLYEGPRSVLLRARWRSHNRTVVLKTCRALMPTAADVTRLQHERERLAALSSPRVVKVEEIVVHEGRPFLVLEDFGGTSLDRVMRQRRLDADDAVRVALGVADVLRELLRLRVLHGDLNPSHLIVNVNTGALKIIDFGTSRPLTVNGSERTAPVRVVGALPYMAPEQTRRTGRAVDYRADYYAAGAVLYELVTGRTPFEARDPVELVAAHLALIPPAPHVLNNAVSESMSAIILRLLQKAAEDRYQSPDGLTSDLQRCLDGLQLNGAVAQFSLGEADRPVHFSVSGKMYGREEQLDELLVAFEASLASGNPALVLVAGPPGIGKSSLLGQVQRPLVQHRGFSITAKYDALKQGVPYTALVDGFNEFLDMMLSETEATVNEWRAVLQTAVGDNGTVLCRLMPALELLLGPQPPVAELSGLAAQNRLDETFLSLVRAIATTDHPLALFLDDLQWVDSASLRLVERALTDGETRHLVVVGAYRDNEVDDSHALFDVADRVTATFRTVATVVLRPLCVEDVNRLVADSLYQSEEATATLATIVHQRTGGNPFFVKHFMEVLHRDGVIARDSSAGGWHWSVKQVEATEATPNVIDSLVLSLEALPADTRDVLTAASCIGGISELAEIEMATSRDSDSLRASLEAALDAGYVYQVGDTLFFGHDRITEAAYSLCDEARRSDVHMTVGTTMLSRLDGTEGLEKHLFDLLRHLEASWAKLDAPTRERVVELRVLAGARARDSAAYDAAVGYFERALETLGERWDDRYELVRDAHLGHLEALYLTNRTDDFEAGFDAVLARLRTRAEQAELHRMRVVVYVNMGRLEDAVQVGCAALEKLFGLRVPTTDAAIGIGMVTEIAKAKWRLRGQDIAALIDLPELQDEDRHATLMLMSALFPAAFVTKPLQFVWMVCRLTNLCLKYGQADVTAAVFLPFTQVLGGALKDYDSAHAFGLMSLEMGRRRDDAQLMSKLNFMFAWFCAHWKQHAEVDLEHGMAAYRRGAECGDYVFASYGLLAYFHAALTIGTPLDQVAQEIDRYAARLRRMDDELAIFYVLHCFKNFVRNLRGKSDDLQTFTHIELPEHAEDTVEQTLIDRKQLNLVMFYWLYKLELAWFAGDLDRADELVAKMLPMTDAIMGELAQAEFNFFHSLVCTARAIQDPTSRRSALAQVRVNQKLMRLWASHCPQNFQHKVDLVDAEVARLEGRSSDVGPLYLRAAAEALEHRYLNRAAMAHERLAEWYAEDQKDFVAARSHWSEAMTLFASWGAHAKVRALAAAHPGVNVQVETGGLGEGELDLRSILSASRAVAEEIVLDRLLERLMKTVLSNAGADRGMLLLHDGDGLIAVARSVADGDPEVLDNVPLADVEGVAKSVVRYAARSGETVVLGDAGSSRRFGTDPRIAEAPCHSVLCMPVRCRNKQIGVLYLENTLIKDAFDAGRVAVLDALAAQTAISVENARLVADLERSLETQVSLTNAHAQFVPHQFLQSLGRANITDVRIGDSVQKEMTILFSDIRGFTPLIEGLTPEKSIEFINQFLGHMEPALLEHGGFIDSYIGDSVMALFDTGVNNAVRAARDMLVALRRLNARRQRAGERAIQIGIGLNTGTVMLGTIGGKNRLKCGVIGDPVNLAARVESLTKQYHAGLLITEATHDRVTDAAFSCARVVDVVQVVGRQQPVRLYEVFDEDPPPLREAKLEVGTDWAEGLQAYYAREFDDAAHRFDTCRAGLPDDTVVAEFLTRARVAAAEGVPEDWTGIVTLRRKRNLR